MEHALLVKIIISLWSKPDRRLFANGNKQVEIFHFSSTGTIFSSLSIILWWVEYTRIPKHKAISASDPANPLYSQVKSILLTQSIERIGSSETIEDIGLYVIDFWLCRPRTAWFTNSPRRTSRDYAALFPGRMASDPLTVTHLKWSFIEDIILDKHWLIGQFKCIVGRNFWVFLSGQSSINFLLIYIKKQILATEQQ